MRLCLLVLLFSLRATAGDHDVVAPINPDDVLLTSDAHAVGKCESRGELSARSYLGLSNDPNIAEIGAERVAAALRKQTAEHGGTVLFLQKTSSFSGKGTAYRCSAEIVQELLESENRRRERESHGMPERAFDIESGFIGIQSAVTLQPGNPLPLHRGKPTLYILFVRNESDTPVYAVAKLLLQETPVEASAPVRPHRVALLTWNSYGVPADVDIPLDISIHSDQTRAKLLGTDKTAMFFGSDDLKPLFELSGHRKPGEAILVSGWKEMTNKPVSVAGTQADEELQRDIVWSLDREESRAHRDCPHSFPRVERREVASNDLAARFPNGKPELLQALSKRKIVLEEWSVQSCDALTSYDVLLLTSPGSGTDILINRTKN